MSLAFIFFREHYWRRSTGIVSVHLMSLCLIFQDCFESLLKMLYWGWNTFTAILEELEALKGNNLTASLLDLERLVSISTASLRLLRTFICEVYPVSGKSSLSVRPVCGSYAPSSARSTPSQVTFNTVKNTATGTGIISNSMVTFICEVYPVSGMWGLFHSRAVQQTLCFHRWFD